MAETQPLWSPPSPQHLTATPFLFMNLAVSAAYPLVYANMILFPVSSQEEAHSSLEGVELRGHISQWPLADRLPCGKSGFGQEGEIMSVCSSGLTRFLGSH